MSTKQEFIKKVAEIQLKLKSPKSQFNKFGNYAYRNQEDILESLKPLLGDLVLFISDEVVEVGGRVYVKATSTITDGENSLSNSAYAQEPEEQKGMNAAMLTGSASSYSRKYSLNGLFLIDDTKDADATTTFGKEEKAVVPSPVVRKETPTVEAKQESKPTEETSATNPVGGSFRRRARG